MYKLEIVKAKELEPNHFYIRKVLNGGLVLSIYLGKNQYGPKVKHYFYDCVGLLGTSGVLNNQDWDLQYLIDRVFERKIDKECLTKYETSNFLMIYKAPIQYQVRTNIMQWYEKNRLMDSTLEVINETIELEEQERVTEDRLVEGEIYYKGKDLLYYYNGKTKEGYQFMEISLKKLTSTNKTSYNYHFKKETKQRLPKLYSLETSKAKKILTDEMYELLRSDDFNRYVKHRVGRLCMS